MKFLYIWIFLLVGVGILISIYLIPSKEDIAFIQFKGKEYQEADQYYSSEYQKGNRSPDVLVPLYKLELQKGNIKKAITLLEEYLRLYPNDLYALNEIKDLYLTNLEYHSYFMTLLKMKKLKPSKSVLQELSAWYSNCNNPVQLFPILQELVKTKAAEEGDYLELAYLYAQKKNYKNALQLLETRREKFPNKVDFDNIFFEIWLLTQLSKETNDVAFEKRGTELLAKYLTEKNNKELTRYSVQVFNSSYPERGSHLISLIEPLIHKDPKMETIALEILWSQPGKKKEKFANILKFYSSNPTNPEIQNLLFTIFLDKKYDLLLLELIKKSPLDTLEEKNLLEFVYYSQLQKNYYVANELQNILGEPFLQSHPLVAISLDVVLNEQNGKERLAKFLEKNRTLSQTELFFLLKISAAQNYYDLALKIGDKLSPFLGMSEEELAELASIYIEMKRQNLLYQKIQRALPTIGNENAEMALALLEASMGQPERGFEILDRRRSISANMLYMLYFAAEAGKEYHLALQTTTRLVNEYPTSTAEAYHAVALVQTGNVNEGVLLAAKVYENNAFDPKIKKSYFDVLVSATKKDLQYAETLKNFMHMWRSQETLPSDLLLEFGYIYLEVLKDFNNAEWAFQTLVDRQDVYTEEVKTLVYLWGPVISCEQLQWLRKRAFESTKDYLGFWLQDLVFVGDFETVIKLFKERLLADWGCKKLTTSNIQAYFAYLDALSTLKRNCELREAIDYGLAYLKDIKLLEKLIPYTEQAEYLVARSQIWESIVAQMPCNALIWQRLGKSYMDQRAYCNAAIAFQNFFSLYCEADKPNEKLYETLFNYGEILEYQECLCEAKKYYYQSLAAINTACRKTYQMLEVEALIYAKLEWRQKALAVMCELYEKSSRDPDIAASYANMMLSSGRLKTAQRFIRNGTAIEY